MNTLLLTHIAAALAGLVFSGLSFLRPSKALISTAWGLTALTLGTGTYLIWTHPAHAAQGVTTGVVYLAFALTGILAAQHKLRGMHSSAHHD